MGPRPGAFVVLAERLESPMSYFFAFFVTLADVAKGGDGRLVLQSPASAGRRRKSAFRGYFLKENHQ
jgi:hypothetical protein